MTVYTSGDYAYFNNMTGKSESCHIVCILNQISDMYIASQLNILVKQFVLFPKLFLKTVLWIRDEFQYSKFCSLKKNRCMEQK